VVAAGLGLGVLAKGPVVLLFIVPPALLAPWWWPRGRGRPRWLRWYLGLVATVAAGAALALAWALPAAAKGGEEYGRAILLGQTAGRLAGEVPHPQAWWWYLALLPALLFPFALWPDLLRVARRRLARPIEPSLRFCLAWALPAFVLLSAIGSKQVHYLLPLLPAVALLAARASSLLPATARFGRLAVPMLALLLVGALVTLTPWIARVQRLPHWLSHTAPGPGLVLVAAAVAGLCCYRWRVRPLLVLTAMSMLIFLAIHLGLVAIAARDYDLEPVGDFLAFHQEAGHPVAHIGKYHGQYHFAGRLREPFEIVSTPQEARRWLRQHPGGRVVGTFRGLPPPILGQPDFEHRFRSELVGVWSLPLPDLTPRVSPG
jgi:4-amino-4-deoxy-L-arabinose transferase-like glycosyltransferase